MTARRLAPLARGLLEIVNERGWIYSDSYFFGVDEAAVKRAADQLLARGLVWVNMQPEGRRRGVWQIGKIGRL
jgi:hypothetical protein